MRFISLFFLSFLFLANNAMAEAYYIELGRAGSEAEATQMWADVQSKNKILASYDVFPNAILQPDGSFIYRVQAGPMLEKGEAQRVCNKLYRKKISCFVIEGFDPQNIKSFEVASAPSIVAEPTPAPVTQQDFVLPWLVAEPVKEESAPVVLPPKEEPVALAEMIIEAQEAQVEVAEAIIVPLTDSQAPQETVSIAKPIRIATFEDSNDGNAATPVAQTSGWLSVQPFLDAARAQNFWNELRQAAPARTRGLSIKIVKPTVSHDIPKVILSMGSFESEDVAMQFCKDYVTSASDYLECSFNDAPPAGEGASASSSGEAQPVLLTASEAEPQEEQSLFWVEVLNEKTQDIALSRWETIRTDNDDLLSNVRSQIVASMDNQTRYTVRIGPLNLRSKAEKLCKSLGARGVSCKVTSL